MTDFPVLAERVRTRRGDLTYRAAASEIGIGVATLHGIEQGKRPGATVHRLLNLWLEEINSEIDIRTPNPDPEPARETISVTNTITGEIQEIELPIPVPVLPPEPGVPEGFRRNAHGRMVPDGMIGDHERRRDDLVRYLHARGGEVRQAVADFRRDAIEMTLDQIRYLIEMYGGGVSGQRPSGNIKLTSFDGELQIRIERADKITLNERVHAARELFDRALQRWSRGSPAQLQILIREAFALDRAGGMNVRKLLDLARYDIDDPDWQAGCRAIRDAVQTERTKWYVRLYRRRKGEGKNGYEYLPIDLQKTPASEPGTAK